MVFLSGSLICSRGVYCISLILMEEVWDLFVLDNDFLEGCLSTDSLTLL